MPCLSVKPIALTAQAHVFEVLSENWGFGPTGSITLHNQDVSLNYSGVALSFTDGTYTTTKGSDLFNATGTWTHELVRHITLDTKEEVSTLELIPGIFDFSFTQVGGAVVAETSGNYVIT
ncbi:MAG: hypothetical protein ACJAXX_001377 [Roseivirga sp.]|jgi:hypothetical protein